MRGHELHRSLIAFGIAFGIAFACSKPAAALSQNSIFARVRVDTWQALQSAVHDARTRRPLMQTQLQKGGMFVQLMEFCC